MCCVVLNFFNTAKALPCGEFTGTVLSPSCGYSFAEYCKCELFLSGDIVSIAFNFLKICDHVK